MVFDIVNYLLFPLLIFYARIADVSLSTIRIVFVSKGLKSIAPILGFFEVLIWIIAINKLMTNPTNIVYYLSYAGGFATGTLIGMMIEKKLLIGKVIIRLITQKDPKELIEKLKKLNYPTTTFNGEGNRGKVKLIFLIVNKRNLKHVTTMINEFNPQAFYSIEDVNFAREHYKQAHNTGLKRIFTYQRQPKFNFS